MRPGFPCRFTQHAMLAFAVICAASTAAHGQIDEDLSGLVWIAGSVVDVINDQPAFDLGEAHSLRIGETVAIVRPVEFHFRPIGSVTIEHTEPLISVGRRSSYLQPEKGDRVLVCRTLRQLGTPEQFRDDFVSRRLIARSSRNGYYSLQTEDEAAVLQRFAVRQPKWVRNERKVAGELRSATVDAAAFNDLRPLLEQIQTIRELEMQGVPVRRVLTPEWQAVMDATDITARDRIEATTVPSSPQANGDADAAGDANGTVAEPIQVGSIRRFVDQLMFTRSAEERMIAVLLCCGLEHFSPRHEDLWIREELRKTQFARLADDAAWLREFEAVMQKVRQQK